MTKNRNKKKLLQNKVEMVFQEKKKKKKVVIDGRLLNEIWVLWPVYLLWDIRNV